MDLMEENKFKILEWNINHRQGYSSKNMPEWVATVIREDHADADIIILTECSSNVPNWETIKKSMFAEKYLVFESFNNQGHQNDVVIAIKKERFSVKYTRSHYSANPDTADHLEIKCKIKEDKEGKELTVIGMRIHSYDKVTDANDQKKCNAFQSIINDVKNDKIVVIGGDLNNYRRGCTRQNWCLGQIDKICQENGFMRYTPQGSSIYEEKEGENPNAFAEDHFIVKGIEAVQLLSYDRSFVNKDTTIYRWGKNFQIKLEGNNYDHIDDPYPDHAILMAEITIP